METAKTDKRPHGPSDGRWDPPSKDIEISREDGSIPWFGGGVRSTFGDRVDRVRYREGGPRMDRVDRAILGGTTGTGPSIDTFVRGPSIPLIFAP